MIIVTIAEWMSFIGRFHPLVVHLPIGFLVLILLLEVLNRLNKIQLSTDVISFSILVTAISATVASLFGYFLSLEGGYNEEILEEHQFQGIGLAIVSWILWIIHSGWLQTKIPQVKVLYLPLLIFSFILMLVAGHHGGNLTHGESYLTENTPQPFRSWIELPDKDSRKDDLITEKKSINLNEALVFQDIVKPIIKQKCEQCHNSNKMKGDLRMDDIALFQKGGKHGIILKPNDVSGSELIKRILLPESDEEHMPPKGKNQITEHELEILKWWIEQGAAFDKKITQLTMTDKIKRILGVSNSSASISQNKFEVEESILSNPVSEINQSDAERIKKVGGLVLPLSKDNNYVELTFLNNPKFSDKDAQLLSLAPTQTLWLKISNTQISDKSSIEIAKLKNLTRLHLENTKISDVTLSNISSLQNLEYLNLNNTTISDKGLEAIAKLKNLKKVYVWKTNVTAAGIDNLKKKLPEISVEVGISEQQMAELVKNKPNEKSDDVYKK